MNLLLQKIGLRFGRGSSPWVGGGWKVVRAVAMICNGLAIGFFWLAGLVGASAINVPAGFTETVVPGPAAGAWSEAVGVTFSTTGRMFVWERAGRIWFRDPGETNFTQLLNISEEVANWGDHGMLGFTLDPEFNVNGNIYLLYAVDRHYLLNFGTGNYNANSNLNIAPTIGRVTRYTCTASNSFRSVDVASRFILVGETKTNGFPILSDAHAVGSLVFGQDGTLLVSCGDGASAWLVDTGGDVSGSFASQALADGIIKTKENVGGYRAQLVDCLGGKILRIDPATGNGLPSNPFYDATKPRSAKSRVWALGQRNPFRASLRPNSGSHDPADGLPGSLYIGNVGWDNWEALKVVTGPGQNMGWPLFEGLELTPNFVLGGTYNVDVNNLDATNALCGGYFSFRQLLKQDTTNAANQPPFNNPCNPAVKIPSTIPQFLHRRPVLDWNHASAITRAPTYDASGAAVASLVGAVGSPVSGTPFQGTCASAGVWYTATNLGAFPTQYLNTYFMADWTQGFIKNISFTTNDYPVSVGDFASGGGAIVSLVQHPVDGSLYYVTYNYGDAGTVRQLSYTGNRTPVPVIVADQNYGPGPLTVQFNGSGSSDPDGQAITYAWNFGDGTAVSSQANPTHIFTAPGAGATNYTVTLTVTDSGGASASMAMNIAVNDTPPSVTITSPTHGALYSLASNTTFNLTATVTDNESPDSQLKYSWATLLRHNDHSHVVATSTNHVGATALVEPIGCDGVNIYYFSVALTVTDPSGLAVTHSVDVFPNCGTTDTPPTISDITNRSTTLNVATTAIPFTIGDAQVAPANLQLRGGSSNPALVPTNNIVFGGVGASRTVTVTPAANMNGTVTISVNVNDGPNTTVDTFLLTVTGSNTPPTISSLTNQTVSEGTATAANAFTIGDANTAAGSLFLSGSAANAVLVPASNITFGGTDSNRTVTVTPAAGQTGTTVITVVVSDGQLSASNNFSLTVTSLPAGTKTVTNSAAIAIFDGAPASPYPSAINISGLGGVVTNVTATVRSLSHSWSPDIDVLLVGPAGQRALLMADAGSGPITNANLTFSSAAAGFLAQSNILVTGTYKPTDYAPTDIFPSPAPAGPYATNLSVFNGQIANGAWLLYVVDDGAGDTGRVATGWSLTVATSSSGPQPPTITDIANQTTLTNTPTAPLAFTIADLDTPLGSLTLSNDTSNPTLVPPGNIVFGGSGANRTVTVTPAPGLTGTANITVFVSDGTNTASDTFLLSVVTSLPQILSFTNAAGIGIRDTNGALPYPSTINVTGMAGTVSNVTVTLRGFTQTWASDVDVLLVGPGGQSMVLMSDAGNAPASNLNLTFSDAAASALSTAALTAGTYRPTNLSDTSPLGDNFPAPAPVGPHGTNFATFNGTAPNGSWSLYVFDDGPGDTGTITNGWSLTVATQPGTSSNTAPTITAVSNQVTVVNTPTAAVPFTIGDTETAASNLLVAAFSSNPALLPTNRIVLGGSGGSRTVTMSPTSNQLGSATVALTVSDGTLTASNSFVLTVNPAPLIVTENSFSRGYGATNPVLTGSLSGLQAGDNITASFATSADTNSPVGAYPIIVTLADPGGKLGNYVITTNQGTLTVTNARLTVVASSTNKLYGATRLFAGTEFTITSGALFNGNTLTNVVLASAGAAAPATVGAYPITATNAAGAGLTNYAITYGSGTLTVIPAALGVTANNTNKAYGNLRIFAGTEFSLTSGTLFNGNTLTNVSLSSPGASATAPAGSYPITATNAAGLGLTNYTIAYQTGTFTVGAANLLITAASTNKPYGTALNLTGYLATGLLNGDTVTNVTLASLGSGSNAAAGSYPITPSGALGVGLTNYLVGYSNGTLTVSAANLLITAANTNKAYGVTLNPAAYTTTGLLNADSVTNVSLTSSGSPGAAPVGSYPINAFGAQGVGLTNYTIGYSNGTLSVGVADLLIAAGSTNKVYGATLFPVHYLVAGLLNGDSVTNVNLASAGSASNAVVNVYPIVPSAAQGVGLTNYNLAYTNGTLTVAPATLLATADNQGRAYGQPNPAFTISYTGFVNGENTNVLDALPVASTTATPTSAPGNYLITVAGGADDNYVFSPASGTLAIAPPGPVTITTVEFVGASHLRIAGTGDAQVNYQIEASLDLTSWTNIGSAPADGAGAFEFVDTGAAGFTARYYRVAMP